MQDIVDKIHKYTMFGKAYITGQYSLRSCLTAAPNPRDNLMAHNVNLIAMQLKQRGMHKG